MRLLLLLRLVVVVVLLLQGKKTPKKIKKCLTSLLKSVEAGETEPKSSSQKDSQTTKKTDKDRDKERYRMLLHLIKLQASAAPPGAAENFKQYRTPASLPSKSYMAW